jgi:hypothetical protein
MGIAEIRALKLGGPKKLYDDDESVEVKLTGPKPKKPLKQESDKTKAKKAGEKNARGSEDTFKEAWFKARRREMVGVCQCGCGQPSHKHDDQNFRGSAAHIFPKSERDGFPSIALHPLNWVERRMYGGCHDNMDNGSMDKWPNFADWDDIKEKFYILAPLLTDEERAKKFYTKLESLVYAKY